MKAGELPDPFPSIAQEHWEGAKTRLRGAMELLQQRANEGQSLPRSMGLTHARVRLLECLGYPRQELLVLLSREEASEGPQEPPLF